LSGKISTNSITANLVIVSGSLVVNDRTTAHTAIQRVAPGHPLISNWTPWYQLIICAKYEM